MRRYKQGPETTKTTDLKNRGGGLFFPFKHYFWKTFCSPVTTASGSTATEPSTVNWEQPVFSAPRAGTDIMSTRTKFQNLSMTASPDNLSALLSRGAVFFLGSPAGELFARPIFAAFGW